MRKDEVKKRLGEGWPGPDPGRKRVFFRTMPPEPVSHLTVLVTQAGYIRKSTWAASAAVLALALAAGRYVPADAMWVTAALTPFAALSAVAESARSALCGMEELELACRFGRKSVALARMGAMGLVHFLLLAALAAALGDGEFFRTGVYFLTPYLLTDLLGLATMRRVRGREALYVCAGEAVLVAGLAMTLHNVTAVYAPESFHWWLPALAAVLGLTGREYVKTIKKTEELSWNW